MSNKKKANTKKPSAKKPVPEKKEFPKVIIAVIAVIAAVAVGTGIYFIAKKDKPVKPDVNPIVTVDGNSKYEMAEYKGTKMPVEFVEILNQAELDSYEACEKYGVALELGERKISMQEFVMYYYDVYYFQTESAMYSIQQTGANRTGFDLSTLPRDQKHAREDYTWAEHFTIELIDSMALNYMMFDEAVEKGVELDNGAIGDLFDHFDFLEKSAESNELTLDEDLAATYCEGVTAAMYKAREIIVAFAVKYDEVKSTELKQSFDMAKVETERDRGNGKYSVAKLRVYPIEGEYVESEAMAVKTEQQLIDYAAKNFPRENYNAEFATDCGYISKDRVSSVYGDEVAAWAFAGERKAGDISVVQGLLFRYLVYVEVPAFYSTSCDIMFIGTQYDDTMSLENRAELFAKEEERYLKWKNEDGTKEGFYNYTASLNGMGEETIRIGTYHFEIDNWIFDPARKSGDSTVLDTVEGCCAIYYIEKNEGDYDWEEYVRVDLATVELENYQSSTLQKNYGAERKNSVINKAYDAADKSIAKHQKKLAEKMQ